MKKLIIMSLLALFSLGAYAETAAEFKARVKAMSDSEIMALLEQRVDGEGQWTYSDNPDKINKVWTGIGACRVSDATSCSSCACDYYFKSNHPNNRHKGTNGYTQVYNGYTKNLSNNAGTGCMQVTGFSGGCYHNSTQAPHLCGGSLTKVSAAHVREAMDDPKDPCGIEEYLQSIKPKSRFSVKATELQKIIVEKKENQNYGRCGLKVDIPQHIIKPRTLPVYAPFLKKFDKSKYDLLVSRIAVENARIEAKYPIKYGLIKLSSSFCKSAIQYKLNNAGQFPGQTHLTRAFQSELSTSDFDQALSLGKSWDGEGDTIVSNSMDDDTLETAMVESQYLLKEMTDMVSKVDYRGLTEQAHKDKYKAVAEFVAQEIHTLGIETDSKFGSIKSHESITATVDTTPGRSIASATDYEKRMADAAVIEALAD